MIRQRVVIRELTAAERATWIDAVAIALAKSGPFRRAADIEHACRVALGGCLN